MAVRFIGCGTAKCGSTSLYHLIKDSGVDCKHERHLIGHELPWQYDRDSIASKIKHFKNVRGDYGEIAFYFLPYIPKLLEEIPGLKVICLKRNLSDTVRSFINTIEQDTNPWHGNTKWSKCYPRYDGDLNSCIHEWYRTYYELAESLEKLTPNFRIFNTESLNSHAGQGEIFKFLGIKGSYKLNCRYNVSNYPS